MGRPYIVYPIINMARPYTVYLIIKYGETIYCIPYYKIYIIRTKTNQFHPSFSIGGCHEDPYVFISAFETWLLQFSTVRFSTVSHSAILESSKYSCSDYSQSPKSWTYLTPPSFPSLATCTKENQAQGLLYLLYYTDWRKSEVHVRTCQCIHSIQMPALIIR